MVDEHDKKDTAAPQPDPGTPAENGGASEAEGEKTPQIPIKQVPMDGVCGGY